MKRYVVEIAVVVHDEDALRAYALKRATEASISEKDMGNTAEHWLAMAFDNGTPDNAGFDIEASNAFGADD